MVLTKYEFDLNFHQLLKKYRREMDREELDFKTEDVIELALKDAEIANSADKPYLTKKATNEFYITRDKDGRYFLTNKNGHLFNDEGKGIVGSNRFKSFNINNKPTYISWKNGIHMISKPDGEYYAIDSFNENERNLYKDHISNHCILKKEHIPMIIEARKEAYEEELKTLTDYLAGGKLLNLTHEAKLKKLEEKQQVIETQLKTETDTLGRLELEGELENIKNYIKAYQLALADNDIDIEKTIEKIKTEVEKLQSLKEAEIKAEYLVTKENFEKARENAKEYLDNEDKVPDEIENNFKSAESKFNKAKKALDTIDKEKELIKMNNDFALLEKEKNMLDLKNPDQQTRIGELEKEELILSKEIEVKKQEIVLGKAITSDEEQDAKKELEKAEKNLEYIKITYKVTNLMSETIKKETQLQTKESDKKELEKEAFRTQKEKDIKKAQDKEEEVKQMRGELEGLKKEKEKILKNRQILRKEVELLDDPGNKKLEEELSKLKLESKVLDSNDEEKTRAEEIGKAIEEKKQKIKAVAADPFKFITTPANIKEVAEAELELLKAQRDELIVTDDEEKKKEVQNNIENKRRELAEKRKNFSKKNITTAIETYALTQPTYSLSTNNCLVDSNAAPITKKIEVDGRKEELKYLKFENNYYLTDESGNLFNEKGKPIEYTGANDIYHYAIIGIPNSPTIRLVNNADSSKYLQINYEKIFNTYILSEESGGEYMANAEETIENIKAKLIKEQVDVDEIGVYRDPLSSVSNNIEQYCKDNINKIDIQISKFEGGIRKIEDTQRKKAQGNDVYFNDKELEEQKREAEAKKGACKAQKHFWEEISETIDTSASGNAEDVRKVYRRLKEFEDISNKITELSQNFDYGNPTLNDKNIAAMEGLADLVERKAKLEEKQRAINESREDLGKNNNKLGNEAIEDLKNLLDEQQKILDEAYKDIASEQVEIIGEIEKFNNIDEDNTDELSKATEAIKNSIKSIEEKSEVKEKIKNLDEGAKSYEDNLNSKLNDYERLKDWSNIKDFEGIKEHIKNFSNNDFSKFVERKNDYKEENDFTKEHGGIDTVIKAMEGTAKFTDAVGLTEAGYTIKEKRWYSNEENKVLIAAQETYDENVDKIKRLKIENEELRKHMDPFENENNDNLLKAIQKEGVHFQDTRKDAGMLLDDIKGDCIKDFLGIKDDEKPTQEMEQLFNSLTPEERTSLFEDFLINNLINNNNKYDKYSQDAKNLLINTFKKREGESFKQIAINNKAIDLIKDKNLEIVKNTKDIVDKKLTKVQYKKDKETYKQFKRTNTLGSDLQAQKMAKDLQNKKKELDNKRSLIKNAEVSISEIKNRSTTFRKNIENKEILKDSLKSLSMQSAQQKVNTYKQQKVNQSKTKSGSNISFP